jgi:hypothetical protein
MINIIPYNLFEFSKISVDQEIEKMAEVLEYIFNYDYIDLIKEVYGENAENVFHIISKPQLEFGLGHEFQNKKIDKETFKKILYDIFDVVFDNDLNAENGYNGIIEILSIENKKRHSLKKMKKHYVLYVHNLTSFFLLEPFTDVHEHIIRLDSYKSTERIFKEFYDILKKDMKDNE